MPPTYPTVLAAGIIPYLKPTLAAAGNKVIPPPTTVPSAPNFNLPLIVSAALSLPLKPSKSVSSVRPTTSERVPKSPGVDTAKSVIPPIPP